MTKYIENIIIGNPTCDVSQLFALDSNDWETKEKDMTYFTNERNLAKILVELGFYPSISEIKRNKPELCITLDTPTFIDKLKIKKKKFIWICVF